MNIRPKVKICGLTRFEDVRTALEMKADFLGFIVYSKSPRSVSLEMASELMNSVPVGKRVLVDVDPSLDDLDAYKATGADFFQIHTGPDFELPRLRQYSEAFGADRLWLAPRFDPSTPFPEKILDFASTILIDTFSSSQVGGTGKTGDWGAFRELQQEYPSHRWILAGGIRPENVLEAIESTGAEHVDVNSGVEREPGIKNPDKVCELFRLIEQI